MNSSDILVDELVLMRCSFVGTYMEREAEALIVENLSKKYVYFSRS